VHSGGGRRPRLSRSRSFVGGDAPAGSPPVARVDRAGADVRVRLAEPGGAIVAQRTLPATGDCGELAELVAVTVSTWMTELRPEWLPAPRLPSVPVPAAVPAAVERLAFDAGVGAGVSVGEGGAAAAAGVLLSLHSGARGFGAMARASATTGREVDVGVGTATWRRWEITAGPSYQWPLGDWRLAASVGFSAGWLSAEGQGFAANQTSSRFSPGAAGLVRVARAPGAWSPWFAVGASVAFFNQPLSVVGSADRRDLHAVTIDALLGISIGRFP
jgi:hypothetical protein